VPEAVLLPLLSVGVPGSLASGSLNPLFQVALHLNPEPYRREALAVPGVVLLPLLGVGVPHHPRAILMSEGSYGRFL